jgi:hypothetical protein
MSLISPPPEPPLTYEAAKDLINAAPHILLGSPPLPWNHCLRCLAQQLLAALARFGWLR